MSVDTASESITAPVEVAHPRDEQIAFLLMTLALIVAPLFAYPFFLMQALCFALFACAFNLLVGYVGLLSFGHAMFLGSAGYFSAHIAKVWGWPPELAIITAALGAGVIGIVTGALAIRRQGIYFSMITLALSQMIYFFCLQAPFTHGEDGIQAVPQGKMLGFINLSNQMILYYVVLAIFLFGFLAIHRIINSPFGEILKAIRENEPQGDFARLQDRPLQARGVRLVRNSRRSRRRDQSYRCAERLAHGRTLVDVG